MLPELILALVASVAFGCLYNVPLRSLLVGGLAGMCSWLGLRLVMGAGGGTIMATLVGALSVGIVGEWAARHLRAPASIFILPGIVPLVPGAVAYSAMLAFLRGDVGVGATRTLETVFSAGAIAAGLIITGSLARVLTSAPRQNKGQAES